MSATPWTIVARREVLTKLTDKSFLVGTVGMLLAIAGFLGFQVFMEGRTSEHQIVTTSTEARQLAERIEEANSDDRLTITIVGADNAGAAQDALDRDGGVWLHQVDGQWTLTGTDEVPEAIETLAGRAVQQSIVAESARALGIGGEELQRRSTVRIEVAKDDAERSMVANSAGFVMAMLFYITSLTFGYALSNSVLEEKESRLVEIIATKIPVSQLLAGKVLGNLMLAFAQMALIVAAALLGLSFTKYSAVVPAMGPTVAWFAAFFVVGFALLSCGWAVAGALASRSEDVQSTSSPILLLTMAVLFAAVLVPESVKEWLMYLPPFSTVLMPTMLVAEDASWWQALIALGLLVIAAALVVRGAARIYQRSLLQTQGRISMRQAWTSPT